MHTLASANINGYVTSIFIRNLHFVASRTSFRGQKIMSGIDAQNIGNEYVYTKINDRCKQVLNDPLTEFDVKFDGSCGAIVWDGTKFIPYARFDIKRNIKKVTNKKGLVDSEMAYTVPFIKDPKITENWIECESCPKNGSNATHWPHFKPLSEDSKQYVHYQTAFDRAQEQLNTLPNSFKISGKITTIEYMGPHFNMKKEDPLENDSIVIHGSLGIEIPMELRNYNGLKEICSVFPFIEGIVVHGDYEIFKIRRDMFKLQWGSGDSFNSALPSLSTFVALPILHSEVNILSLRQIHSPIFFIETDDEDDLLNKN